MVINKYKDIIINNYNEYDEDARLVRDRGHNVEYLTTMRYIQKFLKPGANILEIGAATGVILLLWLKWNMLLQLLI